MTKYLALFLALMLPVSALSAGLNLGNSGFPSPSSVKTLLNLGGANGSAFQTAQLGTQLTDKKVQLMKASYNFSVQGGSDVASLTLRDVDGKDAVLPANAVIKQVMIHVITAMAGSGASVSLQAVAAGDLKATTAISGFTANALIDGVPVNTAASSVKTGAANRTLYLKFSTTGSAVSAGKFNVFVEYYLSNT